MSARSTGCRYPVGRAVTAIDALARATRRKIPEVELLAERYQGAAASVRPAPCWVSPTPAPNHPERRGCACRCYAAGFPPQTQIPIVDEYGQLVAVVDISRNDIKVTLDCEGAHHRDPDRFNKDIHRHDAMTELGWIDLRITSRDTEGGIVRRLQAAWARRP